MSEPNPSKPPEVFRDRLLRGARFIHNDLAGATFIRSNMAGVQVAGCWVADLDIDAWAETDPEYAIFVSGVNVWPYVDAELNKLFPGRETRTASTPEALVGAWDVVTAGWQTAIDRAMAMPEGTVDASVEGEWSFSQTLRHMIMVKNAWFDQTILGSDRPFDPIGMPNDDYAEDGFDMTVFSTKTPQFADVLRARAHHHVHLRDYLLKVTPEKLADHHQTPWEPDWHAPALECLQVILSESWDHLRYATRDLDALERAS